MQTAEMVFLAISPAGLEMALRSAALDDVIWCGADAITEFDFEAKSDARLTRFDYDVGIHELGDALGTIREHHPGQTIWVEAA